MSRPAGMLPGAFQAYLSACKAADVGIENIVQTVGDATLSAGFHAPDGHFTNEQGVKEEFTAATDISVRHPVELTGAQTSNLLLALFHAGFCPYWRHTGVFESGPHIHMVWPACAMKPQLRGQVHDFCHGRDGLAGHNPEAFWSHFIEQQAWAIGIEKIRAAFLAHNPPN